MIFNARHHFVFIAVLYILMNSCNKEEVYSGDTPSGGKVIILGHAGMGFTFSKPANSYESISTAISIGCDGSEMDIRMSNDSVIVAYHDLDLANHTTCNGNVLDMNWSDLKSCKYNMATKPIFLVSVDELFAKLPNLNELYFSFDCKVDYSGVDKDAYQYRFLRAINKICLKYRLGPHIFIEGPAEFLDKAKYMGMDAKLFLITDNRDHPIDSAKQHGFFGISTIEEIPADDILSASKNGLYVMVWDPDNFLRNKETLNRKPDIIQTDDPISMLKLLKRYNYENVTP